MKNFIFLAVFLVFGSYIFSQNLGDVRLNSISIPPPGFSPTGTNSSVITNSDFDNFYLGNDDGEPYIAVNPADPKKQVCAYNINSFYYTLNGIDWTRSYPNFPGYNILGDPCMTYDNLGNLFYVSLYSPNVSTGPWGIVIAKSTNNGVSWTNYYRAHQTTLQLADKEWITADLTNGPYANNLYIGWRQYGTSGMGFIRSTNNGANWSTPLNLLGGQGAYVSVGPNGNIQGGYVYFACQNAYCGSTIFIHRSSDGGESFEFLGNVVSGIEAPGIPYGSNGRPALKNTHIRVENMPRMAVDNGYTSTRGNVYIVYSANPTGPDLADIFFVKSTNYGVSWSEPVKLNDDGTTTDQWLPTIAVDNNTGKIFVTWYDSRNDPANNILTEIYGTTSTNGGATFAASGKISNASFNPDNMAVVNLVDASYIGDYNGTASAGNGVSSITAWMDNRTANSGIMQSFVGYFPDFAFKINPGQRFIGNNDSSTVAIIVPAVKGIYNDKVKFSVSLDTLPVTGSINFTFANGKDTITSFPDSVYLKIKTVGAVTPQRKYKVTIYGAGTNGTPIHRRYLDLYVNSNILTIQSNRNSICNYNVNGAVYNTQQQFIFPIGTSVNVKAVSPQTFGGTRYIFGNWSDNGDTSHNIIITGPLSLTVNYKPQYLLIINSNYGNIMGNTYHDSGTVFSFGVFPRIVSLGGGQGFRFRGWDGNGNGSYTSSDSSGMDTIRSISLSNAIVETARWTPVAVGIHNISGQIPDRFQLHQNYPNPFNPSSTIRYEIPKNSFVKLIIYDMLGRELEILVMEKQSPGIYEATFNASRYSSGIYYYKLTTEEFNETKKMILLK